MSRKAHSVLVVVVGIALVHTSLAGCSDNDDTLNPHPDESPPTNGVDVHQHLATGSDFERSAANLIDLMDEVGINRSLLLAPPGSGDSAFAVDYDYQALRQVADAHSDRLGFIGGGKILNSQIDALVLAGRDPTAEELDAFEADARSIAAAGAAAFGELAILHLSYRRSHPFIAIPGDHPMLLRLAEVAADVGIPIDVHLELCAETVQTPPFFRSPPDGNNPQELEANLEPFERLLAHRRDARIVWVHVGWDNIGHTTVDRLRLMLRDNSNLYLAVKMLDDPGPVQLMANRPLDENGTIRPEWLALITEFHDRFLLGADEFVGDGGATPGVPSTRGTWALLDELPVDVAREVAGENATAVYRLSE